LNTVEFAIRDGVPVAIDFCNPAPDAEAANIGQANFEWVSKRSPKWQSAKRASTNPAVTI